MRLAIALVLLVGSVAAADAPYTRLASQPTSLPGGWEVMKIAPQCRVPPRLLQNLAAFIQATEVRYQRETIPTSQQQQWCDRMCDGMKALLTKAVGCSDGDAFFATATTMTARIPGEWSTSAMECVSKARDEHRSAAAAYVKGLEIVEEQKRIAAIKQAEEAKAAAEAEQRRLVAEAHRRCMADKKCKAERDAQLEAQLAEEICGAIAAIADVRKRIATERRYARRVGVVNLSDLQDLKEELRMYEEKLVDKRQEYRDVRGKRWPGRCPKVAP